nr:MAG TPA: hypothetical protein [Caudoviricetes sp.]
MHTHGWFVDAFVLYRLPRVEQTAIFASHTGERRHVCPESNGCGRWKGHNRLGCRVMECRRCAMNWNKR